MKANINTLLLTIGIIVKNEEKVLPRCLDGVKKLMQKIPCELIVTDTGSTDRTTEIASEYGAILQNFEWCDDFAAARNCATNVARGKWFLQLDADEWFTDELIDNIANFLTSKQSDEFNSARFFMRNFTDFKHLNYSDVPLIRFFKTACGISFQSEIHEYIPTLSPTFTIYGICKHSGYCYENEKQRQEKEIRNNTIIRKHLEIHPDDMRMLLAFSSLCKYEEGLTTLLHLEKLTQKTPSDDYYKVVCFRIMQYYVSERHPKKAIKKGEEFLSKHAKDSTDEMDVHYFLTIAYEKDECSEKCIYHAKKYEELYKRYKNGERNDGILFSFYDTATSDYRCTVLICHANALEKLNKANEALDVLLKNDTLVLTDERLERLGSCVLSIGEKAKNGRELAVFYELFKDVPFYNNWKEVSKYYISASESKQQLLAEKLIKIAPQSEFAQIIYAIANKDNADEIIQKAKSDGLLILATYAAISLNTNIDFAVKNNTKEQIIQSAFAFNVLQDKLFDFALKHITNCNYKSVEGAIFVASLAELALNYKAEKSLDDQLTIIDLLLNSLYTYAQNVFINLSDEILNIMPEVYRFGVKTKLLMQKRDAISAKEYVSQLKEILAVCPTYNRIIESLLEAATAQVGDETAAQSELLLLAVKVKQSVKDMLLKGEKAQALAILEKLAAITPNDAEINELRECCK